MKTVLCVPGHDEDKVKKCRQYGADLILFDLEDSVPEGMKDRAREIVAARITSADAIRFNQSNDTDLDMLRSTSIYPHSIWLPKKTYLDFTYDFSQYRSHRVTGIGVPYKLVVIVETPLAVAKLHHQVDVVSSQLRGLAFGAADFASYLNVPPWSTQVQNARAQVALAAAALDIPAYDSPCTSLAREVVLRDAANSHSLGFGWKGVIHPRQIKDVQGVGNTLDADRQLVDLYDRQSEAVMVHEREIIAPPMVRAARRRLENAG